MEQSVVSITKANNIIKTQQSLHSTTVDIANWEVQRRNGARNLVMTVFDVITVTADVEYLR
jgi:hypothetical protein